MKRALLVALVLAVAPLMAQAATLTYKLEYVNTLDASFNDLGNQLVALQTGAGYDATWYNQFRVSFQVTGLNAGEDVATVISGLASLDGAGAKAFPTFAANGLSLVAWAQDESTVTWTSYGGIPPKTTSFTANWYASGKGDGGAVIYTGVPSNADYRNIVNEISNVVAYRAQIGESGFAPLGVAYVQWNGTQVATLGLFADPDPGASWGIYTGNGSGTASSISGQQASTTVPDNFVFGVPEPATMALLALGGAAALLRRRR